MTQLFLLRLKTQILISSVAWLLLLITCFKFPEVAVGFSVILMTPAMFVHQSHWYLVLPYSRKKLLCAFYLETLTVIAITAAQIFSIQKLVGHHTGSPPEIGFLVGPYSILIFVVRATVPVMNPLVRAQFGGSFFRLSNLRNLLGVAVTLGALFYAGITLLWVAAIVLAICSIPYQSARALVLPQKSLRTWRRNTIAIALLIFASTVAGSIASVFYLHSAKWVNVSLTVLGPFAVKPSHERIVELSHWPQLSPSPIFKGVGLSDDDWTKRTSKCDYNGCLSLSDNLLRGDMTADERFARFEYMMSFCKPALRGNDRIRCSGPHLYKPNLKRWLDDLVASGTVNAWLASKSDVQNFVAIRALANTKLSSEQTALVGALLTSSPDLIVRKAAELQIKHFGPEKERDNSSRHFEPSELF